MGWIARGLPMGSIDSSVVQAVSEEGEGRDMIDADNIALIRRKRYFSLLIQGYLFLLPLFAPFFSLG